MPATHSSCISIQKQFQSSALFTPRSHMEHFCIFTYLNIKIRLISSATGIDCLVLIIPFRQILVPRTLLR
jgi:hypothetical protein